MNRAPGSGAPTALLAGLIALVLARLACAWIPGSWAWGLDGLRHLSWWGWLLWALAALALFPPVARTAAGAVSGAGTFIAEHPRAAGAIGAVAAALLVWLFPDRIHFAGDFLLREHALDAPVAGSAALFPQAMPLDLPLHDGLARFAMRLFSLGANDWGRLIGAVEAGTLAWLAARIPAALGFRGAAAFAAAQAAFWSGALCLMTGYNKSFSDLGVVVLAVGVYGAMWARSGRGAISLGAWLAAGLMLHRVAVLIVPAAAIAFALGAARHGGAARLRRPDAIAGLALSVVALAVAAPILLRLRAFDTSVNFAAAAGAPATFAPRHLLDLANLILYVAPLALLVPVVALARPRAAFAAPERIVLAALVVPLVGFLPWFHPTYGLFRNFDDAIPTGVALSLAAGALAGWTLEARAARAWFAVPLALAAFGPMLGELWLAATPAPAMARIEAYVAGPPERADYERAALWDFLGFRHTDFGQLDEGAAAFARAAELAPSPRTLRAWAVVETRRGNLRTARAIYRRVVERKPDEAAAWFALSRVAMQLGDRAEADSAMRRAMALAPPRAPGEGGGSAPSPKAPSGAVGP